MATSIRLLLCIRLKIVNCPDQPLRQGSARPDVRGTAEPQGGAYPP